MFLPLFTGEASSASETKGGRTPSDLRSPPPRAGEENYERTSFFSSKSGRQSRRHTAAETRHHLRVHAAERAHHAAAAFAHFFHHIGHLALHLEDLVDVRDIHARARGDAFPARAIDDIGLHAFLFGHRGDDRFLPLQQPIVEAGSSHLILDLADARQHAEKALHAAPFAHL